MLVTWTLFGFALTQSVTAIFIDESINHLEQDDPKLIKFIKDKLLEPPPENPNKVEEIALDDENALTAQYGQPLALESLFEPILRNDNQTKRFYIEAGAYDGVTGSNTLRFELNPLWSGLLVEPNPELYDMVKSRQRNAYTLPSCFSTKTHPEIVSFDAADAIGGIINDENEIKPGDGLPYGSLTGRSTMTLQCVPLYSVLQALGNPRVDFMGIDIEGADLAVIETIPFDKVDISVIMIEVNHVGKIFGGDNDRLRQVLTDNDYVFYRRMHIDDIYVKKDFLQRIINITSP